MVAVVCQMNFPTCLSELKSPSPNEQFDQQQLTRMESSRTHSIVHTLRCVPCGFETIVRERFNSHLPCAEQRASYQLYSCSQCGACSTSETIMKEHGQIYHTEQPFKIKMTEECFNHPSIRMVDESQELMLSSGSDPSSATSTSIAVHHENPACHRSRQGTVQQPQNHEGKCVIDYSNRPDREKQPKLENAVNENSLPLPSIGAKLVCPLCAQLFIDNVDEFVRHLALIHFLPLPSIFNFLTTALLQAERQPPITTNGCIATSSSYSKRSSLVQSNESNGTINSNLTASVTTDYSFADPNKFKCPDWAEIPTGRIAAPQTSSKCSLCLKQFKSFSILQAHIVQQHSAELNKIFNLNNLVPSSGNFNPTQTVFVPNTEQPLQELSRLFNLFESKQSSGALSSVDEFAKYLETLKQLDSKIQTETAFSEGSSTMNCFQFTAAMKAGAAAAAKALGIPLPPEMTVSCFNQSKSDTFSVNDLMNSHLTNANQPDTFSTENKHANLSPAPDRIAYNSLDCNRGPSHPWLPPPIPSIIDRSNTISTGTVNSNCSQLALSSFPLLFNDYLQHIPLPGAVAFSHSGPIGLFPFASTSCETDFGNQHNRSRPQVIPTTCHTDKQDIEEQYETKDLSVYDSRAFTTSNAIKQTSPSERGSVECTTQQNGIVHNTLRKTRSDMKVIQRYLVQVKQDTREIHQIPSDELDHYIQDFVLTAKKKDGHEYEPESLKAFVHSLERHLKQHDYPHSVLKGNAFMGTRSVLNQRLNELRALSRSSAGVLGSSVIPGSKRPAEMAGKDYGLQPTSKRSGMSKFSPISGLVQTGMLGKSNPQAILNSLWLINRTQFNVGGTQRHRNLVWGQFQLVTDESGTKAIKFTPLFESAEVKYCYSYGNGKASNSRYGTHSQMLHGTEIGKRQTLPFNCVELFEIYSNLRPIEARGVSEPFYLCPDPAWEETGTWFKTNAAGSQLLSRVPRLLGLKPTRETNQSAVSSPICHSNVDYCNQEKGSTNFGSFSSSSMMHGYMGRNLCEGQKQMCTTVNNSGFPLSHSMFVPGLLNYLPFIFPNSQSATSSDNHKFSNFPKKSPEEFSELPKDMSKTNDLTVSNFPEDTNSMPGIRPPVEDDSMYLIQNQVNREYSRPQSSNDRSPNTSCALSSSPGRMYSPPETEKNSSSDLHSTTNYFSLTTNQGFINPTKSSITNTPDENGSSSHGSTHCSETSDKQPFSTQLLPSDTSNPNYQLVKQEPVTTDNQFDKQNSNHLQNRDKQLSSFNISFQA